jgi:aminoglycoside 3-N-acetyltransferase I
MDYELAQLSKNDVPLMKALLRVFAEAFEDPLAYQSAVPSDEYLQKFLGYEHTIALIAKKGNEVAGGLVAYELEKFEQDRREIYIYDLAVAEAHRRKGLAKGLIRELQKIAKERKAYVIFVQADPGDAPAIKLYESLGAKESVFHFDIPPDSA